MEEAATMLRVSTETIRRLIAQKQLPARQACRSAPWIIEHAEVEKLMPQSAGSGPRTKILDQLSLELQ